MKGINFTNYLQNLSMNSNKSDSMLFQNEEGKSIEKWFNFSVKLRFYSTIILVVLGIVCNLLTIAVFWRPSLRKSYWYLMMLAVADTCVLIAEGRSNGSSMCRMTAKNHWL